MDAKSGGGQRSLTVARPVGAQCCLDVNGEAA
jgi:hypothetical protein